MNTHSIRFFTTIPIIIGAAFMGCNESSSDEATASADAMVDLNDTPSDMNDTTGSSVNMPEVCVESSVPPQGCECASDDGFSTYTFEHQGDQRCLTVFENSESPDAPLPLIIQPDCYSGNELAGPRAAEYARLYGFHYIDLTSPDGGWSFPNNNQINADNYSTQCDAAASKDIGYLQGAFMVVDQMIADGKVDADKVFVQGFSQNSMFSVFMATCFPDRIAGIWQGGSGLYSEAAGSKALPNCEGACTADAFQEHGAECVEIAPCENCEYFPVFPEKTGQAIRSCIMMYQDDKPAHSTALSGYTLLKEQGHEPRLAIFEANREQELGGHSAPVNEWAWITSCLEIQDPCSEGCSAAVVGCMNEFKENFRDPGGNSFSMADQMHRDIATRHYGRCLEDHSGECLRGCAATRDMLTVFETPICECDVNTDACECETSNLPSDCE